MKSETMINAVTVVLACLAFALNLRALRVDAVYDPQIFTVARAQLGHRG